jgi:hypothetical protein
MRTLLPIPATRMRGIENDLADWVRSQRAPKARNVVIDKSLAASHRKETVNGCLRKSNLSIKFRNGTGEDERDWY